MEKCIEGAKWLIDYQVSHNQICNIGKPFTEFQKVYSWTNENISAYLKLVNFENKNNALAVMASGDHAFNLATNGIRDIDTFDTNRLTEYYALGFKRAMILKYDYYTFVVKMNLINDDNASIEEISNLILELLPYMENRYAIYWKSVVDFNFKVQRKVGTNLNLFKILTLHNNVTDMTIYNDYLKDEEHYELLRKSLGQTNITFKCANACYLASEFNGQYDFILLSNILDYFSKVWKIEWGYEQLQVYERELESIMSLGGIIFLKYIYNYGVLNRIIRKHAIIGDSSITIKDLVNEEVCRLANYPNKTTFDGMILKRVR